MSASTKTQEKKVEASESFHDDCEQFIINTVKTDRAVTDAVNQTTIAMLKKSMSDGVTVYDVDGDEVKSGRLKTGYLLRYSGGDYPIAVRGDVTGEGNVNTKDIKQLMDVLADLKKLSNEYYIAADYNFDGIVDTCDLVLIAQKYESEK